MDRAPADAPPAAEEALDARVRRVDPDRWLASRFVADPVARATLVAVYALNDELARIGESVTQALAGEIRLAWWRDRLGDLAAGGDPPGQPVLKALAGPIRAGHLPRALLGALVEARHADVEPRPFADDAALAAYLDGTAGAVMGLAAHVLSPQAPLRAVVEAGRAWGLAGLMRARPQRLARGRDWTPASWGSLDEAAVAARAREEVEAALAIARPQLRTLEVAAFPAVAYLALAGPYARGRRPGALETRVRLLWAVLTGRV